MPFALNAFNLIPGKEDQYRRYSVLAGRIIYGMGGRVVAAGQAPLRYLHGDVERRQLVVVQFPSESVFQHFLDEAQRQGIHELRETATTDYIWTLYADWDMRAWVRESHVMSSNSQSAQPKTSLVLLPGLLCDHALWEPQIAALGDVCEPWVPDLSRDDSIAAMAERALAEAPSRTFALAGLSMGGYVAREIMRQAPERVTRLALLDTRASMDTPEETQRRRELIRLAQTERGFTPITNRMLPLLVHPARIGDEALVSVIRGMAERTGVDGYVRQQHAVMARPDTRAELARIGCPTLVLCGRQDTLTPLDAHEELVRLIPGARLVVIEQCGHLATLERPAEVSLALRNWLEQGPA
jgi:pimeloyl-ACP methyl ester carboxylesterase